MGDDTTKTEPTKLKVFPDPAAGGSGGGSPPPQLPAVPKGLPPWAYVLALALLIVGVFAARQATPPVPPPADPSAPHYVPVIVPMQPAPGPAVVQGSAVPQIVEGDRQGPARRLLARLVRHRLSEQLQKDGFALVGGNPRPLTKAEADRLLANLDEETLVAGTQVAGGLGDGRILDTLGKILDWIVANQDKILAVVKFFLTILMVFADGSVG